MRCEPLLHAQSPGTPHNGLGVYVLVLEYLFAFKCYPQAESQIQAIGVDSGLGPELTLCWVSTA
jgi:hypothetical protein